MPATASSDAGESVFTVDTLLKYMGNDDKALAVVSKIVRDACAPGMEPVRKAVAALQEQRLHEAARIFHSLRGSVGTLGAKRMVSASLRLEQAINEQRTSDIPGLLSNFQDEYQLVLDQAAIWLAQHAGQ
jgi:HPt (histidine-containing phosphotransfer) domain-containing protein